ncbi:MAG TPA: TonB dependent receptor [Mucilaginibacter sp.]
MAICNCLYAQNAASIQGKVSTENHVSADLATVILLAADSSILKSTVCDNNGIFKFNGIGPGKYLVLATKIGYNQALSGPYQVSTQSILNIALELVVSIPQLKEVSVTAKRPYVEVRPGKVVLNVQSSIIAEGNSAFEILRQAPGVHVKDAGGISIIGRQNALVTIDGKPTNLSADNLADFLQGMQSSTIQQIELITNPSAKYDAAGAGVINIITRKGINVGTNGTFSAGTGVGSFYKANAGLSFNNRTDKVNVFGSYAYAADNSYHSFTTDRRIDYNGLKSDYNADYYTTPKRYNNNFRLGTDYYLSPNNTLGVLIYGYVNNQDYVKRNSLKIANNGVLDSTITAGSKLTRSISNITYDINYNGVLDKAGKTLSADVLYNNIDRHSAEYITNDFYNAAGGVYRQPLLQQNLSPSSIANWVAKVDYVNPISKTSRIEAGIKYSRVKSDNDLIFGPLVNGQYQADPKFSNRFIYTEIINAGYVNYIGKVGKLNIEAGLRAEQTNAKGNSVTLQQEKDNNYFDLFPHAQLAYQYDDKNDFTLGFTRGIQRPSYTDINPFLYYVDLYDYRSGNPNLLPEYTNTLELSHTYNKTYITTLYALHTTGFYDFNNYVQNDISKVDVTTFTNFGTFSAYGLRLSAPVQFTNWWNAGFFLDAAYQRTKAYAANGDLNKGTQDINFSSLQNFTLSNTINAELSGKYESPTFYGIGQFKANYNVDAGISKQLFNKKATLKLAVTDIFNTHRDKAHSTYQNLNLTIVDKIETRIVRLNFTYRFGKTSVKSIKHQTANEDEQKRVGSSN